MKPLPLQTTTALLHSRSKHRYKSHASITERNIDKDSENVSELEGERMDELERDFLFGHTVQRKQREDCLTIKCPLLHTAVTNSLWIPSIVKYSNTQTFHNSPSCRSSITITTSKHLCENSFLPKQVCIISCTLD